MLVKIYASGTNVSRLARCSKTNQFVISVPYHELEKEEEGIIIRRCYRLTVSSSIIALIQTLDEEKRPSWNKIWDRPEQNKAAITEFVQSLTGQNPDAPMVLSEFTGEHISCFQLWVSADVAPMNKATQIIQEAVKDWHVVVINGKTTTGIQAELYAKRQIEFARKNGKVGVIFVNSIMTARSWSISEVQACVLAYDKGSLDSTCQKSSRCLTPGKTYRGDKKKYGHIVDVGFNSNRSDKIEGIVLMDTLMRMQDTGEDYPTALRETLRTVKMNLFGVNGNGYARELDSDEMFKALSDEEVILRIANSAEIDESDIIGVISIIKMIKGGDKGTQNQIAAIVDKVKNTIRIGGQTKPKGTTDKEKKSLRALLEKARNALNQSATSVVFLADKYDLTSYRTAVSLIAKSKVKNSEFSELFGVDAKNTLQLLDHGFLNEMMLDIIVDNSCQRAKSMNLFMGE